MENIATPKKDRRGLAIAALVVGIITFLAMCPAWFLGFFGACCIEPLAIAAVVLGLLGLKSTRRTLAMVGIGLGGVAILIWLGYAIYDFTTSPESGGLLTSFGQLGNQIGILFQTIISLITGK